MTTVESQTPEIVGQHIIKMMEQGESFIPALGHLLYVKGRPFTEGLPVQLENLFSRALCPSSICVTGRQIGKSTSQAARTILLSAAIPFFQTLTITPQFEMTRRYSNNYIRPLISQSPVSALMLDTSCENNVLQRTFANNSIMHFSFAFLDADRVRGLAIDRVHADECILEGSKIQTISGVKLIGKTLQKTDIILAHDDSGSIVTDEVVDIVFKGTRPTYRIRLVDGRTLECTNNEKIRTNFGWLYLQEIIDYGHRRHERDSDQSNSRIYEASAPGNASGRRFNAVEYSYESRVREVLHHTRQQAGSLLPSQGRNPEGLCPNPSCHPEKHGMGQRELCLQHGDLAGIRILALPLLQVESENRSVDEVGDAGVGGAVGRREPGVLVHGRREHQHEPGLDHAAHTIIHKAVCTYSSKEIGSFRAGAECKCPQKEGREKTEILGNQSCCGRLQKIRGTCEALYSREHDVQDYHPMQLGRGNSTMPVLRGSDPEGPTIEQHQEHDCLRKAGVQGCEAQDHLQSTQFFAPGCCERPTSRTVSEKPYRAQAEEQGGCRRETQRSCVQNTAQRETSAQEGCSCCIASAYTCSVPVLRNTNTEGQQEERKHDCVQQSRVQTEEAQDYLHQELVEIEIESIEYAGDQRVWDVETKNHHTLFVNGFAVHNCQDIASEFIPEIVRTMDRSKWRIEDYTGTPKTLDNIMEVLWLKSSQAEWLTPCACGYINNPRTDEDGLKMIGDKGLVCAKCQSLIDPKTGYWYHNKPEVARSFVGYHVPQIIMPFHYEVPRNWKIIVAAKNGAVSKRILFNEILGESCDVGAKLITESDLRKACNLPVRMEYNTARKLISGYGMIGLGVDWGGRGEDELSRTKAAIMGMRPDGRCDCLYAEDMSNLTDPGEEVARCIQLFHDFNCKILAHDAAGTAGMRDVLMNHARFPRKNIMPMSYVSAWSKEVISYIEPNERLKWAHYSLDKTRSLLLTIECIKHGFIFFPEWNSMDGFLKDFLALIEEKVDTRRGADTYLVRRAKEQCDDFSHAVNFAMMALFHTSGKFPDLVNTMATFSESYLQTLAEMNADQPLDEWIRETK